MFKTANEFCLHIEARVQEKGLPYMDAVLQYCDEHDLEPSDIASLINSNLKDKIAYEMRKVNLLPPQGELDI